jgi:hypothetical protein
MSKKESDIKRVTVGDVEVSLKHDFMGWRVVHPLRNPDGSLNWKNIISGGSWFKLIFVAILVAILLGAMFEYYSKNLLLTKCLQALNDSIILVLP